MASAVTILTLTLHTAIDRVIEAPDFVVGQHTPAQELHRYPAGKGINVSRALSVMGRSTVASGWVGKREQERFEQYLKSCSPGRAVPQLVPVEGNTRENITILDPSNRTDTHLHGRGFSVDDRDMQRLMSKISIHARPNSVIVISGSVCHGVTDEYLSELATAAQRGGARLVLDTGLSPTRALLGASGQPNDWSQVQRPAWMIKPNREELLEMLGEPEDTEETILAMARRLQDASEWVLVTLGSSGALLVGREGVWRGRVEVASDQVQHTVGCGDCTLAGALDAFAEGLSPDRWLRRSMAAGAANAMTPAIGDFTPDQLHKLENEAQIEKVA